MNMSAPRLTYCMVVSFYHKIDGLMMGAICVLINVVVFKNSYDTKFCMPGRTALAIADMAD